LLTYGTDLKLGVTIRRHRATSVAGVAGGLPRSFEEAMETPFSKPGRFWRGNLHTHSTRSDGRRPPEDVCRFYEAAGYDFLVLTDHFLPEYDWPITDTAPYRSPSFTTLLGAELHRAKDTMELGNGWHLVGVGLPPHVAPPDPDETGPELARRALATGAFVIAAHPQWFGMTEGDLLALGPVHALELYNASAADDNDAAESVYMLDLMLARGKRFFGCATDDAHFILDARDRLSGWVMVKSEDLTPEPVLAALKNGDFYSSTGPTIHDLVVVPGERLWVSCSPANRVFLIGGPAQYAMVGEQSMTEAEFDLRTWRRNFVRVLVRDDAARKAWTNAIWFDSPGSPNGLDSGQT
jgi:hypothetical protein